MIEDIEKITRMISEGRISEARKYAEENCPHRHIEYEKRNISMKDTLAVFIRDGFIDRYSGKPLIFPGMLRVITQIMPEQFPFQEHWKMSDTHIAYWELMPTIDHIQPIARGGANIKDNMVTTNMIKNSVKSNWTLEELNWTRHKEGDIKEWDGLMSEFISIVEKNQNLLETDYIKKWYIAAKEYSI